MSSHREAPAISKDAVADSTDLYAFVSPDDPNTVTIIANYSAWRDPVRRPELLRVRRRRPLPHQHRQRRRRQARDRLRVPVQHRDLQQEHVPLQRRADHESRQRDLDPQAVLHGHARRRWEAHRPRSKARLPAMQHRSRLDLQLRVARVRGDSQSWQRAHGVRRPAARPVLR